MSIAIHDKQYTYELLSSISTKANTVWNHFWKYIYPENRKNMTPNLPNEIWDRIIQELNPIDILNLSVTSQRLHAVSLDKHVWKFQAEKHCLFINSDRIPIDEFRTLTQFENKGSMIYNLAKTFGPSSLQGEIKRTQLSIRKNSIRLKCLDIRLKQEFVIKFIEEKGRDTAIINYGSLPTIWQNTGLGSLPKNHKVKLEQALFDYLTKLISGDTCGLFHNGQEDLGFLIRLADC
jgi:hypothetical protein